MAVVVSGMLRRDSRPENLHRVCTSAFVALHGTLRRGCYHQHPEPKSRASAALAKICTLRSSDSSVCRSFVVFLWFILSLSLLPRFFRLCMYRCGFRFRAFDQRSRIYRLLLQNTGLLLRNLIQVTILWI